MGLLNNFTQIVIETPVDKIINQVKELITSGELKPGDKLPSERKLCEAFGVGRSQVRDAIRKLEYYGILRTLPQSGTVVSGLGMTALEGLIADMLKLGGKDFKSLVATRVILETNGAALAAKNRSEEDILNIKKALKAYRDKKIKNEDAVEEDLLFHLAIIEASQNSVLKSLMLIIAPDVMTSFKELDICGEKSSTPAMEQHEVILKSIIAQDVQGASEAMRSHLSDIVEFTKTLQIEKFHT